MPVQGTKKKIKNLSALMLNSKAYAQLIGKLFEMWKKKLFLNLQFAHCLLTPNPNHYLVYS